VKSATRLIARTMLAIVVVFGLVGLVGCKRDKANSTTVSLPGAERLPGGSASSSGLATGTASGSLATKRPGQLSVPATSNAGKHAASQNPSQSASPAPGGAAPGTPAPGNATPGNATPGNATPAKPGTVPGATPVAASGMKVRIVFWNDTSAKAPTGCEVVLGTYSYKPNTSGKTAVGSLGPAPFFKKVELVVYPTGRGGKRFAVPLTLTPDMKPNSEQDAIHIAVSDSRVRVLGNAVFNFDQIFVR